MPTSRSPLMSTGSRTKHQIVLALVGAALAALCACDRSTGSSDSSSTWNKSDYGIAWNAAITYGSVVDGRDNQVYRTVTIGTQTWMAENLNYKPVGIDSGWCYDNSTDSCSKYGRLYTWAAAMGLNDSCNTKTCSTQVASIQQGICPAGWHVPSGAEWTLLTDTTLVDSTATTELKSIFGWLSIPDSNIAADGSIGYILVADSSADRYGFRALPAGYREKNGAFDGDGIDAFFWTSSERLATTAFEHFLGTSLQFSSSLKSTGISLRCLKNP